MWAWLEEWARGVALGHVPVSGQWSLFPDHGESCSLCHVSRHAVQLTSNPEEWNRPPVGSGL